MNNSKIVEGGIYTFNPSKSTKPRYNPEFAFILLDYVEKSGRVYLQKVKPEMLSTDAVIIKDKAVIETYWYQHTQDEIDTYEILYGK